jgi:transcriptional regulator GlxA family with amidase domain
MSEKFGFLIFDDLEELDLIGPWEMISLWGKEYNGPEEIFTVSQQGGLIKCAKGMKINSDYSFSSCPELNFLLVPGGKGTRREVNNPVLIEFIRNQAMHCHNVLSVCTGSFLLHAAGLLNKHKATTHWLSLERLKQFKEVITVEERYIKDGMIWTAAGISAGIDMALAFIADIANDEIAGKIQLHAEYFPEKKQYCNLKQTENLPIYLKRNVDNST